MTGFPASAPPLRFDWNGRSRTIACHSSNIDGQQIPNSLGAVRTCLEANAPRIEVDLRLLADGTAVAFHDAALDPSTDGVGRLEELTWKDVRAARLRSDPDLLIPRFQEVIDLVAGSGTVLHVDLKPMNRIPDKSLDAIERMLRPMGELAFVGSQASWTLDALSRRGLRTAFDPFRHLHRWPDRPASETAIPRGQSRHGFWDDAPCGFVANMPATEYAALRIDELVRLVPSATEWMVEKSTVRHFAELGFNLGDALHERSIALSAWTVKDDGPELNRRNLEELFRLGVARHPKP
jgi:glycerophosphoryl diester phosphodiesterase